MISTVALRCPKCAAEMVTYERSGISLDQCRECRGIYLDRGELERLVDAEGGAWIGPQPGVPTQATDAGERLEGLGDRNQTQPVVPSITV